jgi:hypothetical protein
MVLVVIGDGLAGILVLVAAGSVLLRGRRSLVRFRALT